MTLADASRVAPVVLSALLIAVVLGIATWDIWSVASDHPDQSVSNILGGWATAFPVLPLVIGVVIGHIFWTR